MFCRTLFTDHAEEVRAIIQRAAKDVAIESSLKTYEEVWLSKIFELRAHTRMKGPSSATAATQDVIMVLLQTLFYPVNVICLPTEHYRALLELVQR